MKKSTDKVQIVWGDKANLYTHTESKKKIASLTMTKIGYVIAWHEFIPQRISQRLSSIWSCHNAAELVIYAAVAETIEDLARKETKS